MSIYSDKLAYEQVVINCRYSVAQMCTCEDTPAHYLGTLFNDDVMRHNTLITQVNILVCIAHLIFSFKCLLTYPEGWPHQV